MWKSASAVDCVNFLSIVCLSLFLIVCPCCCCYCCRCCYSFSAIVVGVIAVIRRRRAVACSLFLSTLFRLASPSLRQFPLLTSLPHFYKRHFKVQIEQRALLLSSTTIIGISHTVHICLQAARGHLQIGLLGQQQHGPSHFTRPWPFWLVSLQCVLRNNCASLCK